MASRVNCEVFQVRTGTYRLTVNRGLAVVTLADGSRFIDPQIEPGYITSLGPAKPQYLKLELSRPCPPELQGDYYSTVRELSLAESVLEQGRKLRRYRARATVARPIARAALVSVVNHYAPTQPLGCRTDGQSKKIDLFYTDDNLSHPVVAMALLPAASSIYVNHDVGTFQPIIRNYSLTYNPDSEEGLKLEMVDDNFSPPSFPPPAQGSGDREPLRPQPGAPALSEALLE